MRLFAPKPDPVTGDDLTLGERAAWVVTGFVRRWVVFFLIQAVAVLWLWFGDAGARTWWNYVWSDMAIVVENITMLALFNQTRRDAVVTRDVRKAVSHLEALLEHHGIDPPGAS